MEGRSKIITIPENAQYMDFSLRCANRSMHCSLTQLPVDRTGKNQVCEWSLGIEMYDKYGRLKDSV